MANHHNALPAGWRWVRLRDAIAEAQPGFASGQRDSNGVIQLRMNNVDTRGNLIWDEFLRVPANETTIVRYRLKPGDIVFNNTNSTELVGKSALFKGHDEPVVYSNHFTRLRVKPELADPGFITFWLISQWQMRTFENICNRWIGQSAVKNDKLFGLEIPLPPLPEQQRIAERLKEQIAAVAQARRSAEEQLQAARALPSAYLRGVFESEQTRSLPKVRFDEIAILQRGYDLPSQNQIPGNYPIMTSSGAKGTHHEFMTRGPGVVTGRSGSIGKVFYVESDYWPHNTALFVKDFKGNEPCYLFYLLQWMDLKTVSSGSGVPTLDRKQVHNVHVPKIDLIDQSCIYKYLDEKMQFSEGLIAAAEAQLAKINCLPSVLLRRAFAGNT